MQERARAGLRIPHELNNWLIQEAEKQGISKNSLILQILWSRKETVMDAASQIGTQGE